MISGGLRILSGLFSSNLVVSLTRRRLRRFRVKKFVEGMLPVANGFQRRL
jgi:hypothetical protein